MNQKGSGNKSKFGTEDVRELCETFPKLQFLWLIGRTGQTQAVDRLRDLYGCPQQGRKINLREVVTWMYEYIIGKAKAPTTDDEVDESGDSPWLEEQRKEKARILRIQRLQLEEKLVDIEVMKDAVRAIVAPMRNAVDQLQRSYGPGAVDIYNDALDEVVAAVDQITGDGKSKDTG